MSNKKGIVKVVVESSPGTVEQYTMAVAIQSLLASHGVAATLGFDHGVENYGRAETSVALHDIVNRGMLVHITVAGRE